MITPQVFARMSLALLLLFATHAHAQMAGLEGAPGLEKIQLDLLQQMTAAPSVTRQSGTAQPDATQPDAVMYRIIVNLPVLQHVEDWRANGLDRLQQRVRAAQDAVIQRPRQGTLTGVRQYENIPSFSALADRTAILELAAMSDVEFIEIVPVMKKMDLQSHPLTGTDAVHLAGFTGKDVTIAFIDDGIDSAHAAFGGDRAWPNDKVIAGYDFADDDADPRNDCPEQSHGTAVAGVAAGNGGGVLGTAPDANIVFLKIQSSQSCGREFLDGDFIAALDWVVSNRERYGIDILSMSLGGQAFRSASVCDNASRATQRFINMAHQAGMVIFAASGNEAETNAIAYPACMSNIISVGAVYDTNIGTASFSICTDRSTGPDRVSCYSNSAAFLDLLAPSHCATTASTTSRNGRESCFGGTSSATPFAAGVAASLLEAADTPLNNNGMRRVLVTSGEAVFDDRNSIFTPRVDAQAALAALDDAVSPLPPIADAPCTDCTKYIGTLSGSKDQNVQPDGTYYPSSPGVHKGWLQGQDQTDFDLYLLKWTGSGWRTVAKSVETRSEESITYQGTMGYYAWIIYSYAGGGEYEFWLQQPAAGQFTTPNKARRHLTRIQ